MRTAVSAFPSPRLPGCWPGLRIARRYLFFPPPNSCSWVRDAVVLPITVVLLSCVGSRALMIAPKRGNGNGFRASDCQIAEYNISSTLLFFTLLCRLFRRKYPEMLFSVYIRADMCSKRYFRSGYSVFRGILGQWCALLLVTLLSTFPTQFSTFRVVPVFPLRFSPVIHGNDRKCIKKCISAPKMSFYENNRAGNAVLSAFPGKILQKNGNKKRASRPSCVRNTGRLVLLCGSCWGVLSESGS